MWFILKRKKNEKPKVKQRDGRLMIKIDKEGE